MSDPIHGDGIFQCRGCGRTFAEYVNGCPHHDDGVRKVVLIVADPLAIAAALTPGEPDETRKP